MEPMRGLNFDWRICYKVVALAACFSLVRLSERMDRSRTAV